MADIRDVWRKISAGIPLNEEEQNTARVLQRNFAPASQEYKMLARAIPTQGIGVDSFNNADLRNPLEKLLGQGLAPASSMTSPSGYDIPGLSSAFARVDGATVPRENLRSDEPLGFTQANTGIFGDDFGGGSGLPNEPSPAAQSDAQGRVTETSPNQTGAVEQNYGAMSGSGFPHLGELDLLASYSDPNARQFDPLVEGWVSDPANSVISDVPLANRGMVANNTEILMRLMGMEDMQRQFMDPMAQAASVFSGMGMLGRGTGGDDLMSGPSSPTYSAANIEDFLEMMNEPGTQFLDPDFLVEEAFSRAENTDLGAQTDPRTGRPLDIQGQIDFTTAAIMSSAPFMTPESQAMLSSRLQQAGLDYMTMVATGDTGGMTFPAYLETLGVRNWLGA